MTKTDTLNYMYTYTVTENENGTITVSGTDLVGNTNSASTTFEIDTTTLPMDPVFTLNQPLLTFKTIITSNNTKKYADHSISYDGSKISFADYLNNKIYFGSPSDFYGNTDSWPSPILTITGNDEFGKFISMSGDANTIAVGNNNKLDAKIRIFKYINSSWQYCNEYNFLKAFFNYNGTRMVLGHWYDQKLSIYDYNSEFIEIKAYSGGQALGNFVSINYEGDIIAYTQSGTTKIIRYNLSNLEWINIGMFDNLSRGISLSKDGFTILVSKFKTHAMIYTYNGSGTNWTKKGQTITGSSGRGSFERKRYFIRW